MVKSSVFSVEIPGVTLEVRGGKGDERSEGVNEKERIGGDSLAPRDKRGGFGETQLLPLAPLRSALLRAQTESRIVL